MKPMSKEELKRVYGIEPENYVKAVKKQMNQQKDWKAEFKKNFVKICSDGELIKDFDKNGKIIPPSRIIKFIQLLLDKQKEEKLGKWSCSKCGGGTIEDKEKIISKAKEEVKETILKEVEKRRQKIDGVEYSIEDERNYAYNRGLDDVIEIIKNI